MIGSSQFGSRSRTDEQLGFRSFVGNILPPPPDRHLVIDASIIQQQVMPRTAGPAGAQVQQDPKVNTSIQISKDNTTLIGDYTSVCLDQSDRWLIQAQGNATISSTLALVKDGMLVIDRRYIFIQLGGNQLRTTKSKSKLFGQMLDLIVAIRNVNPPSRIFVMGVLPRVLDNEQIKPLLIRFNRWLAQVTNDVDSIFEKVKFLPIQLKFLEGNRPHRVLFDDVNPLLLSSIGSALFKQAAFQLAGFVQNQQ